MGVTATIGNLLVNVIGNTSRFSSAMDKGRKDNAKFRKSIDSTREAMGLFNKALAVVGVGYSASQLVGKFNETRNAIDKLAKTSAKLGISTEALASLRFAGEQTGVDANTMDMALQRMTRRVAEAAKGTGEAKDALRELGLDAQRLASMSPDRAFSQIARAMMGVATQGDRVRLAFKLFDSEGVALVNTLALGESGLRDMTRQAKELGIAIDKDAAAKVEAFNDSLNSLQKSFGGLANELVINIAPEAKAAVDAIREFNQGSVLLAKNKSPAASFWGEMYGTMRGMYRKFYYDPLYDRASKAQVNRGIASGTAAPGLDEIQGPGRLGSLRARQPGFDVALVERSRRNLMLAESRAQGQAAGLRALSKVAVPRVLRDMATDMPKYAEKLKSAATAWGEGVRDLEQAGRKFAGDWWLKKLFGPWAGGPPRQESEKQTSTEIYRSINEALEKGTAAAYTASRANLLPKMQLDEARKQTTLLSKIERHTQSGGVTLQTVGIG